MRLGLSPYDFTEARRLKWLREGRGLGDGPDFRPWLQTRNVKSRGRKHRMRGILHDRVMHLMSDLERNAVLHFERDEHVLDIKEQFPLDRDVTRRIAWQMGIPHPRDPRTGVEIVMTTDLLVISRGNSLMTKMQPFSVKEAQDLLDRRVQEKQEIERRYWLQSRLLLKHLLDKQLRDTNYFEAIRWARDWFYVDDVDGLDARSWEVRRQRILTALSFPASGSLGDFVSRVEAAGGFEPGAVLNTLRHLAARRLIAFDPKLGVPTLNSPIDRFRNETIAAKAA